MIGWLVLPVALLCTGLLMTPSYAVFNATSTNTGNGFSAGAVVLQNNSSGTNATTGSAVITATNLQPNATASRCVAVTSSGTVPTNVSLYVSGLTTTTPPVGSDTVAQYITMRVGVGTGTVTTPGDCSNYTETAVVPTGNSVKLAGYPTTFATGSTGWSPTAGTVTRVFRFTYTVDSTVPNNQQNATATATFTWEAQS